MNILYTIDDSLYVNLTNKCPCRCIFCIRDEKDEIEKSGNLWLEHEPSTDEIKEAFKNYKLSDYNEVVFCGYGEPLVRLEEVIEISNFIKEKSNVKVRVNTNGLSDLIHKKKTAILLKDNIDSISISLNAPNKDVYTRVTRPKYGEVSFEYMINFAKECKEYISEVVFSVVDEISQEEIEMSKVLANELGIDLKVRNKN